MSSQNEKQIELINGQLIGIFLFIITLIISLIVAYNEKLQREGKPPLFSNQKALDISFINRTVVLLLGIYFVYDAYERKKITSNQNDPSSNLQILASWLALAASAVILYIIIINYNNKNFNVADIEEPTL